MKVIDLSGELSQPCSDRQALFEQQAVEGVAAECLQIHLVLIVPELIRTVDAGYFSESHTKRHKQKSPKYKNAL